MFFSKYRSVNFLMTLAMVCSPRCFNKGANLGRSGKALLHDNEKLRGTYKT